MADETNISWAPGARRSIGWREQMAKFRKKPVEIEAVQYKGGSDRDGYAFAEMQPQWLSDAFAVQAGHPGSVYRKLDGTLRVTTLAGEMIASPGDWIIRGVKGEIYPCKPDIFAATYDPAD